VELPTGGLARVVTARRRVNFAVEVALSSPVFISPRVVHPACIRVCGLKESTSDRI
jgi:hypothetical protein